MRRSSLTAQASRIGLHEQSAIPATQKVPEKPQQQDFTIRSAKKLSQTLENYHSKKGQLTNLWAESIKQTKSRLNSDLLTLETESKRLKSALSPKVQGLGATEGNEKLNHGFRTRIGSLPGPARIFSEIMSYKGFYLTPSALKLSDTQYKLVVRTVTKQGLDAAKSTSDHRSTTKTKIMKQTIHNSALLASNSQQGLQKNNEAKARYEQPLVRSLSPYLDLKDFQVSSKFNNRRLLDGFKPAVSVEKSTSRVVKEASEVRKEQILAQPGMIMSGKDNFVIENQQHIELSNKPLSRIQKHKKEKGLSLALRQTETDKQLPTDYSSPGPKATDKNTNSPSKKPVKTSSRRPVTFDPSTIINTGKAFQTLSKAAEIDTEAPTGSPTTAFKDLFRSKKASSPQDKKTRQKVVFRKGLEDLFYVLKRLASNEWFEVLEAIDKRTCKLVVVKAYHTSKFIGNSSLKKQVEESIRVHSSVFHPNIARLKNVKQISDRVGRSLPSCYLSWRTVANVRSRRWSQRLTKEDWPLMRHFSSSAKFWKVLMFYISLEGVTEASVRRISSSKRISR